MAGKKSKKKLWIAILCIVCLMLIGSVFSSEEQASPDNDTTTTILTEKTTNESTTKETTTKAEEGYNEEEYYYEEDEYDAEALMVWMPNSGSKYHSYSGCSNMKNPSEVTEDEAISWGYSACSKCW